MGENRDGPEPTEPTDPRERARAAQETKGRVLAEHGSDVPEEATPDAAEIGAEHAPSETDPANAPADGDTEPPTRA